MGVERLVASVTMYSRVDDSNRFGDVKKIQLRVGNDDASSTPDTTEVLTLKNKIKINKYPKNVFL